MSKGQLFSEYFLSEGIKSTKDYKDLPPQEIESLFNEISKLYLNFTENVSPDEADTEDSLIRPILKKLGFKYTRQKSPQKKGKSLVPDFVLFSCDEDKKDFDKAPKPKKPWHNGVCILEGKRLSRFFDKGDKTDPLDSSVPSNQILRYLSAVDVASQGKIQWGILTNGKQWRLYYHKFVPRSEGYIEFNFDGFFGSKQPDLFSKQSYSEKLEHFKLFYLLFRKDAFIPTKWRPKKSFLQEAIEEGKRWEEQVSEDLKNKVFLEVFLLLSKGFTKDAKSKGQDTSEKFLFEVYQNTLVFLYRLLFLFYAEDRVLLPVHDKKYFNYSLTQIRETIAKKLDLQEIFSESICECYEHLTNLFKIINSGDKSLKLPPYNGGLFNQNIHAFLKQYKIPDKFLAPAIDMLSRDHNVLPVRRINYRDLSVAQLGSIYEGLLEFKLKISDCDLKIIKKKDKEIYMPATNPLEVVVCKGELYITNEKAERKATGSYYTPDYIVRYIVRNSIEPLIQQRIRNFESQVKLHQVSEKKGTLKKQWKKEFLNKHEIVQNILKTKILDPAMGSGHFLVGAVDYLADRILEILDEYSGTVVIGKHVIESPLISFLEKIRKKILIHSKEEGYIIDETKLDYKNLIKRIILKRCIYGVDKNPLSVELAKLSLWLHTFTVGAPLSFLDHHLKCGNSLIGADLKNFEIFLKDKCPLLIPQYSEFSNVVGSIRKIEGLTDLDITEVEESNKVYGEIKESLNPFKTLLDIFIVDYFIQPEKKNSILPISLLNLVDSLQDDLIKAIMGQIPLHKKGKVTLDNTHDESIKNQFFHWKLEFPEIWFENGKEKDNGGFDIIVGNPPYDIISALEQERPKEDVEKEKKFFKDSKFFIYAVEHKLNYYKLFINLCTNLLNIGGTHGFIVPMGFLGNLYDYSLRTFVLDNLNFLVLDAFPQKDNPKLRVFPEAKLPTCVYILEKPQEYNPSKKFDLRIHPHRDFEEDTPLISISPEEIKKFSPKLHSFPLKIHATHEEIDLAVKIAKKCEPLSSYAESKQGEVNVTTQDKFINKSEIPLKDLPDSYKEVLRGAHVNRYLLHAPKQGGYYYLDFEKFVGTAKQKDSKFFDHSYTRVGYQRGAGLDNWRRLIATIVPSEYFCADTINYIVKPKKLSNYYILALLNSNILEWRFRLTSATNHVNSYEVDNLPIPNIDFKQDSKPTFEKLNKLFQSNKLSNLTKEISSINYNSMALCEFISILAKELFQLMRIRHLLELFCFSGLKAGSEEKIKVLEILIMHKDPLPDDFVIQKEIAKSVIEIKEKQIININKLIEQSIFQQYDLTDKEINLVTKSL